MARPRKEIDQEEFEKLCGLQCTQIEICDWFGVTDKTLNSWCKRTYHAGFSDVYRQKRGVGKVSLRRAQFNLAKRSASMAIWLGKQYLDQKDEVQVSTVDDSRIDELSKSLEELAKELESE